MRIYEITLSFTLNRDFFYKNYPEFISRNINKILYNSTLFRYLHQSNSFKPYVLGSLTPIEKDKVYKSGKNYNLTIRSIDESFVEEFRKIVTKAYNLDFVITQLSVRNYKLGFIDKIYTITPTILTVSRNRYWTMRDDLNILMNNIAQNLQKKYFEFFRKPIDLPTITYIELTNKTPIVFEYKKGKLFSNKFIIGFAEDDTSQKLAKLAFGVGILEKNPLGFGMVVKAKN
jgi:CRISPR-associated endoribonuclease Cas6